MARDMAQRGKILKVIAKELDEFGDQLIAGKWDQWEREAYARVWGLRKRLTAVVWTMGHGTPNGQQTSVRSE